MGAFSLSADEAHLLIVLFLIYLSDCFLSARSSGIMIFSWFRGTALRLKHTDAAISLARHYWFLRPLFPPLGLSLCKTLPRISLGHQGICSASPVAVSAHENAPLRYISYDDITRIKIRGSSFEINGKNWINDREDNLLHLRDLLNKIIASDNRPQAASQAVHDEFILGRAAAETLKTLLKKTASLNLFCSLYALCLLAWLPFGLCRLPTEWLLWRVGLPTLFLHITCGALFLHTHIKLAPNQKSSRWESFVKMLLCPPMMIRAADVVTQDVYVKGDAAAVIMASTPPSQWMPHIQYLWRLAHPYTQASLPPDEARTLREFSETYRTALSSELKLHGIDETSLEIDATEISSAESYCPRCGALFTQQIKICSDCDGIRLQQGKKV